MALFDQVTFGGSALNRAAELRDGQALALATSGQIESHAIGLWRGKPLVQGEDVLSLLRLPLDHPVYEAAPAPLFLGREAGGLCFAYDISSWVPDDAVPPQGFLDQAEQRHPLLSSVARFCDLRAVMTLLNARDAELASTAKALCGWHQSHGYCAVCGAASQVDQSGWQRYCPACSANHFPRTDPVVIMLITHGNDVLLGRSPGWPEGMYSLLAGFVEPGETPEAAVRREVLEEAGVSVGEVKYLGAQPWAFPSSLMMGFHGVATSREIAIDPNEIEDARWMSREDLMAAMSGAHPDVKPARKGAIAEFILRNWLADRLNGIN